MRRKLQVIPYKLEEKKERGGIFLSISHVNNEVICKCVCSYGVRVETVAECCIEVEQDQ